MKKVIISILSALIVLLGGYTAVDKLGGMAGYENNFPGVTTTATSTASYCDTCPVKLLSADAGRQYARIQNLGNNGATIYLYLGEPEQVMNYALASTDTLANESFTTYYTPGGGTYTDLATSTITSLTQGLIVLTPSSTYEISPDNLHLGEVWATSTTASAMIGIIYR
jgi:hypothetical protein